MTDVVLHTAPWLFSIAQPPIADGAVAVTPGQTRIAATGTVDALRRQYSAAPVIRHKGCALLPGLINAHAHLELSHLGLVESAGASACFTRWVERLVTRRESIGVDEAAALGAAQDAASALHGTGVAAVLDIGNTSLAHNIRFPGTLVHVKEYLGSPESIVEKRLAALSQEEDTQLCTAHAPYSTHRTLLKALKQRARTQDAVFPIHVGESVDELEFIRHGAGPLRAFSQSRGAWDGSFVALGAGTGGSVHYLDSLGIVDRRTLCVHCVHIHEDEIDLLIRRGAGVCCCPGSNRHIRVGTAPIPLMLERGLLPCLGTDSLTSNTELNIWREMAMVQEDHPQLPAEAILEMATIAGARALGLDHALGTIESGKQARILAVGLEGATETADQAARYLAGHGSAVRCRWILEDRP